MLTLVLQAYGAVTSYSTDSGGNAPMEVNMVKGKGKHKGKDPYSKGKGKGKSTFLPKGKGKTKSTEKGKGKGNGGDSYKGSQKGSNTGKMDPNVCAYCGKSGHWARDCRKKKADMQVRQVENTTDPKDTVYSTASATTTASTAAVREV